MFRVERVCKWHPNPPAAPAGSGAETPKAVIEPTPEAKPEEKKQESEGAPETPAADEKKSEEKPSEEKPEEAPANKV